MKSKKITMSAKSAVMQPKYRSRVERDKTKYKRKDKHKSHDKRDFFCFGLTYVAIGDIL